ncbi:MAG TPA: GGDEF domain-containing protein [Planococcus sp. (in: firmicutes)]|nr:GGDEF domain-containing protein [Planococcus sp. (in: firmicutes)]
METAGQQIQELIEARGDFVVLLNPKGIIIHTNQNWIDYCLKRQLSSEHWTVGENYLRCLEETKKFSELQCIDSVLHGSKKEEFQLSTFTTEEKADYLSVKYRQFPISSKTQGIILYKQLLVDETPLSHLNTEVVLESMTNAFFLLDNQMRFDFVNAETEKVLRRKKEELIGRSIWSCFPEAVGTEFYSTYMHAAQERIAIQFEEFFAPLDSWFTVKVFPVKEGGLAVYYQKIPKEEELEAVLLEIPYKDYLTGWPNRRKFEEKIEHVLKQNLPFSLLYINLDNFKHINTFYNHHTGDQLISRIAKCLNNLVFTDDIAARLDGDELILLHLHQKNEDVEGYVKRVREVFTEPFVTESAQSFTVTASIGVSSYPKDACNSKKLVAFGEKAMRTAKKQRGASYTFFHPDMGYDLARRVVIERSLAGDLGAQGFHFAVQPQINCETRELTGIEILSRWKHPALGTISPIEFIAIAEETGTISRLTNYLLEEVFSFIQNEKKHDGSFPKTAINVTPSLLASKPIFENLFALMAKYQIAPEDIEIEITESVELISSEITLSNLRACRSKGISIALDDFGTGFSMLAYLVDYPVDKIKLDKSFVAKIGKDLKSEAVLKSLIQFVIGIDCELLAEGVETQLESEFLQENGCPIHQGFFYDKPLAPEAFKQKYLNGARKENGNLSTES